MGNYVCFFLSQRWIKEMEGVRLKIVTGADSNIMRTIETAIKVGDPCLLMVRFYVLFPIQHYFNSYPSVQWHIETGI